MLIAFEGLDQSGKETQVRTLRTRFRTAQQKARVVSFPDYGTSIGEEIARALQGERDYGPDVMQLLYVANRYERKLDMERWQQADITLLCDRYVASSIAYGEAQGLDVPWLVDIQKFLPQPDLTVFLDIAPRTAVERKATGRDRYERDYQLQVDVRRSYLRQAEDPSWLRVDGERSVDEVADEVARLVESRLL
jgi:dTMP kinase